MAFCMIKNHEEHGMQFSDKRRAAIAARIETQRTRMPHTHYLTTTYRDLEERMCWTIMLVHTALELLK